MQASLGGESPWRRKGKIRTGRGRGDGEREATWMHLAQQEVTPGGAQKRSTYPYRSSWGLRSPRAGWAERRDRRVCNWDRARDREALGSFNPITYFD